MTRGDRIIKFIELYCRVPSGKLVGKPLKLDQFQKKFIKRIYDNPDGTRLAILSMARKNGKTALIAALCLAHIVGPEARLNSQLVSGARSRDQAALVFDLMVKMINLNQDLIDRTRIVPSGKRIYGLRKNVEYQALAAEASTKHGLSPWLVIFDELGQVKGPKDDFVEALETAQGAYDDAMQIVISTQAPTDADLLSIWIDDALKNNDPHTVIELHTAPENDENDEPISLLNKKSWKLANPALGTFRSKIEMAAMAQKAERMPSFESSFRNLYLNQRIDRNTPFISRNVWQSNGGKVGDWGQAEVYSGLDLSSVHDLTAHVPIAEINGIWEMKPTFWLPGDGLREKSKEDRVPYDDWHRDGFLDTTPGRSVEYEWVAKQLYEFEKTHNWKRCAFDRWAMKHLRPWLIEAGFTDQRLDELFVEFGQGFQSMSPALRDIESVLLQSKARHGNHPVLTMCFNNAVVTTDPAGGRKLNKAKAKGRIDGAVAATMAFGVAPISEKSTVNVLAMIV
jgi:phage terminase large subunit-like protein